MKEAFEKHIEQQLKQFEIQPSAMVWNEIEQALDAEKKRRFLPFWFIYIGTILFITICVYSVYNFHLNFNSKLEKKNNIAKSAIVIKQKEQKNKFKNEFTFSEKSIANTKTGLKKHSVNTKKSGLLIDRIETKTPKIKKLKNVETKTEQEILVQNKSALTQETNKPSIEQNKAEITTQLVEEKRNETTVQSENILIEKPEQIVDTTKANGKTYIDSTKRTTTKNKNSNSYWQWNASIGLLTINNGIAATTEKSAQSVVGANLGTVGGSNNFSNTTSQMQQPKGFHASFGLSKSITFKQNWAYTYGLQYTYFRTQQTVNVDSVLVGQSQRLIAFNNVGVKKEVSNYAHFIQIPFSLIYTLQPQKKHPISLVGSLLLSWSFQKQWLVTSSDETYFYQNNSLNQSLFLSANAGAFYQITNQSKVGLFVHQSLTPFHKQVEPKLFFSTISIQFNQKFSFHSKNNQHEKNNAQ